MAEKQIVRIIHDVPPRTHTEPLFSEFDILTGSNLIKCSIALPMYKLNYSKLPDMFLCLYITMKFIIMKPDNWNISTFHHVALILVKCPSNIKGPSSRTKYLQIKMLTALLVHVRNVQKYILILIMSRHYINNIVLCCLVFVILVIALLSVIVD